MAMRDIMESAPPIIGYMLLPRRHPNTYSGVDRSPFEPAILPEVLDNLEPVEAGAEGTIWGMYLPGWRREAYKIYEENAVVSPYRSLHLIGDLATAKDILSIVNKHLGAYEIVHCQVGLMDGQSWFALPHKHTFLGYDIAYPGGDYYSAVKNGLFYNPPDSLSAKYSRLLNANGLFVSYSLLESYLADFREQIPSEKSSDFKAYLLSVIEGPQKEQSTG